MQNQKKSISYNDYAEGIQMLTPDEQLKLMELISVNLRKRLKENKTKKHSIMELEGLGSEIWEGIDAQDFVRMERESWD